MKNLLYFLVSATLFLNCRNGVKGYKSPEEFIKKAKQISINVLFNSAVEARNIRDNQYHYTYVHFYMEDKKILNLPSYEYFDSISEKKSIYDIDDMYLFSSLNAIDSTKAIDYTRKYCKKIDSVYKYLNVVSYKSDPILGKFIIFVLSKNCKVYFVDSDAALSPYWKKYFSKINKVDNSWYYACE